ncbi:MAG: response regulator [Verrucomicrobia bacterium]|nr:response regulator [Verrucomicrobiota bacterium]
MPHTILIVDDNDSFRGMLATVLGLRGYQTIPARTGADGLKIAAERHVEAVLVDVEMPQMDGLEFCRLLREQTQGATPADVPVWIMTGALRIGVNRKAAALGAMIVLRKPLNIDETCAQIERELRQRLPGPPAGPA